MEFNKLGKMEKEKMGESVEYFSCLGKICGNRVEKWKNTEK